MSIINEDKIVEALVHEKSDTIIEISQSMREYNQRCTIICNENEEPIGFISHQDIIFRVLAENKDPNQTIADDIMTKDMHVIEITKSSQELCKELFNIQSHHIPITKKGKLIGLVEYMDLWNTMCEIQKK